MGSSKHLLHKLIKIKGILLDSSVEQRSLMQATLTMLQFKCTRAWVGNLVSHLNISNNNNRFLEETRAFNNNRRYMGINKIA